MVKMPSQWEEELKQFPEHLDSFIVFYNRGGVHKSVLAGNLCRFGIEMGCTCTHQKKLIDICYIDHYIFSIFNNCELVLLF